MTVYSLERCLASIESMEKPLVYGVWTLNCHIFLIIKMFSHSRNVSMNLHLIAMHETLPVILHWANIACTTPHTVYTKQATYSSRRKHSVRTEQQLWATVCFILVISCCCWGWNSVQFAWQKPSPVWNRLLLQARELHVCVYTVELLLRTSGATPVPYYQGHLCSSAAIPHLYSPLGCITVQCRLHSTSTLPPGFKWLRWLDCFDLNQMLLSHAVFDLLGIDFFSHLSLPLRHH